LVQVNIFHIGRVHKKILTELLSTKYSDNNYLLKVTRSYLHQNSNYFKEKMNNLLVRFTHKSKDLYCTNVPNVHFPIISLSGYILKQIKYQVGRAQNNIASKF